jgi:putative iron-dependent peroxidase
MKNVQPGILAHVPRLARYLEFSLVPDEDPKPCLESLAAMADGELVVVGLGASAVAAIGEKIEGLGIFPADAGPGFEVPSTPMALWVWLRHEDRGDHVHQTRALAEALAPAFQLDQAVDAFQHGESRDLTGYEDGTENPEGDEALAAGVVQDRGAGLDGSSFVAVQQWIHDLDHFQGMPQGEQDHVIGRRKSDNEELDDAPESAHVKRTAQETFTPEAFVLRRSMPWASAEGEGLVFVSFGKSFAAFEAIMNRMMGKEDGIVDALFRFTRPVSGSYFWCPPVKDGKLDLSALRMT